MSNKKIALAYPPGLFFSLSLSSRAMSFDPMLKPIVEAIRTSQSLWNRAGSFDRLSIWFRPSTSVSIPLEQGGVFRHYITITDTEKMNVSIPLEQGGVFRRSNSSYKAVRVKSQSLWNRAGSFDGNMVAKKR